MTGGDDALLSRCISLTDLSSTRTSMARSSWEAMKALCSQQGEFIDLDGLELSSASSLLNRKSLHVLLDVQGWNDGGSIALLASRPAPVQVDPTVGAACRLNLLSAPDLFQELRWHIRRP